jgi:hypothetical protein
MSFLRRCFEILLLIFCQSIQLIGLDHDDTLRSSHLHGSIGSVDDRHELEEEGPPHDAFVANVEASNFEC